MARRGVDVLRDGAAVVAEETSSEPGDDATSASFDFDRPLRNLATSLADVEALLSFHEKAERPAKGKPTKDHSTLKRAAIVLIYAAWESFFENLIDEVATALAASDDVSRLPDRVQRMLVDDLRSFLVGKRASDLSAGQILATAAGYDWAQRLRALATLEIYGDSGDAADDPAHGLNSADVKNVTRLLQKYCGEDLLSTVAWAGMSNEQVTSKLEKIVEMRGAVAHTGRLPDKAVLPLALVRDYVRFIEKLAGKLVARVVASLRVGDVAN